MSESDKRIGAQRNFLNEPYMTSLSSHISYKVVLDTWREDLKAEGLFNNCRIGFNMADCNRVISLDFDISDKNEMRNSLFKLDVIIKTCQDMKEDIKTARREVIIGKRRAEELDKEKENGN